MSSYDLSECRPAGAAPDLKGTVYVLYDLNQIADREVIPGFHGKFVHGEQVTVSFWDTKAGATLPEHSHVHQQVTSALSGRFELTVQGETRILDSGQAIVIAGWIVHSGRALTDCRIIDVFHPARDDYR